MITSTAIVTCKVMNAREYLDQNSPGLIDILEDVSAELDRLTRAAEQVAVRYGFKHHGNGAYPEIVWKVAEM